MNLPKAPLLHRLYRPLANLLPNPPLFRKAWLAASLALACGSAALAQDPTASARSAVRLLQSAGQQLDEAEKSRDRVAALTGVITAYEAGLAALRDGLRQVAIHEATLTKQLAAQDAEVSRLIGALAMLEATPQTLLMLHPSGPLDAVRSGMVMAEVAPELNRRAGDLRGRLDEIRQVRSLQAAALDQLGRGLREVQTARTELSQAMAERGPLPDGAEQKSAAALRLAEASDTLEAFAEGLLSSEALAVELAAMPQGGLPPLLPVQGNLLRDYGEADAAGIKRPGWIFATQAQALVTAPAPATIRYLGPLLDYGKVMILEPEADTLLVLAGLDHVYGEIGHVVDAGDPLGLMGGTAPEGTEFLAAGAIGETAGLPAGRTGKRSETLYLEVRRAGKAIDPGTWFEGTKDAN